MIFVDKLYDGCNAFIGYWHVAEAGVLGVEPPGATCFKALLYIIRNKEPGSVAQAIIEFGEVDVDARQVEVAKVQIVVVYLPEPCHQVGRLRVATYEEHGREFLKQIALPLDASEVLGVLHANHCYVGRNTEAVEVVDVNKAAFLRADSELTTVQSGPDGFVTVHQEAEHGASRGGFAVACNCTHGAITRLLAALVITHARGIYLFVLTSLIIAHAIDGGERCCGKLLPYTNLEILVATDRLCRVVVVANIGALQNKTPVLVGAAPHQSGVQHENVLDIVHALYGIRLEEGIYH